MNKTTLRKLTIIIFGFLTCLTTYGQTISERIILTDTKDSLYLNASEKSFDEKGNYCFIIKQNDKKYFVTSKEKIGGFESIGSTWGKNGKIFYTNSYSEPKYKPFYYKNAEGTKVYGTAIGKIEGYQTSRTKENIAIVTSLNDSVYYYVNGKLLLKKLKDPNKYYGLDDDWVSFSENGNVIYYLYQENNYKLYVNKILIDSSEFSYTQLAINDNGNFVFAKGNNPKQKIGNYDYMFFIHTKDTVLNYVRTVWDYELKENGAYYYSGDDNGPAYIAINNKLYKNINHISNITLIDWKNFMFTYSENGKNKINVSDKIYSYDCDEIFYPTLDKEGNFAFYGQKNYYIFKYIYGKKEDKPISKYGVRPTPLYISPKGESIHYFKTADSIYIHQDDKLLFKTISKKSNFKLLPQDKIIPNNFIGNKAENGNSLFYIEFDSNGYIVFNGAFSRPMIPAKNSSYSETKKIGEIVAGEFSHNGFFTIQKTGSSKFLINVNNQIFKELENVDGIFKDNCFFNGKELIFYGVKGLSFYQFKLTI